MIHTDVGCCCSLPDVVSSVVFFCCFLFLSAGIEANCLFFFCPLVLSIIVWLNKRVYKIKLINLKKKKKKKAVNDDSIVTHTYCYVLSVLLTGQKKKSEYII